MTLRELAVAILALPDDDQNQEAKFAPDGVIWHDEVRGDLETPEISDEDEALLEVSLTKAYDSDADGYVWILHN